MRHVCGMCLRHVREVVEAMPEDAATKSRDYGRGYAQAIRDVLRTLTNEGDERSLPAASNSA